MLEIYKDIDGYEGFYQVSNIGNVRSIDRVVNHGSVGKLTIKGRIMRLGNHNQGYLTVILYNSIGKSKLFLIHRLVASKFLDNKGCDLVINHKDGDKKNNVFNNLEWVTQKENVLHSIKLGLKQEQRGENAPNRKFKEADIVNIRSLAKKIKQIEISKIYNTNPATISGIIKRKTWKHVE